MELLPHDKKICFLVGSPRSGTTWLQRLLQASPLICGGEESHFFTLFSAPMNAANDMYLNRKRKIGPLCYTDRTGLEDAIRQLWNDIFTDLYKNNPVSVIHLEKSPFHSFCLDEIISIFPDAKIIFLTRDSRAVASSIVHASRSWGKHWAPDNYREAAIMWYRYSHSVMEWQQKNPDHSFLQIRYEDILENTENHLEKIFKFLTEDKDVGVPELLENFREKTENNKDPIGFSRMRGKIGWKTDMSFWGKVVTWKYTRKKMRELGYEISIFH